MSSGTNYVPVKKSAKHVALHDFVTQTCRERPCGKRCCFKALFQIAEGPGSGMLAQPRAPSECKTTDKLLTV